MRLTSHKKSDRSSGSRRHLQIPRQRLSLEDSTKSDVVPVELNLEPKTSSPDSGSEEEDNQTGNDGSVPSLERQLVGEETNDDGSGNGS
jgi:hypothetical protein